MKLILKAKDLKDLVRENIKGDATLITDEYRGYIPFKKLINHQSVNHSKKQWANGEIHTNNIENFWSILKRGIVGQYHHLSDQWLNKYITEFCFKYNNRGSKDTFNLLLTNALGV